MKNAYFTSPKTLKSILTKPFGFTLVELIVVISILAILSTIAFISIQGFSSSARDSSRISDLSNLSKVLSIAYTKAGSYPTPSSFFSVTYSGATVWNQGTIGDSVINYLGANGARPSKKPVDPIYNTEYTYSLLSTGKEYQIASIFEGVPPITFTPSPIPLAFSASTPVAYIKGNYNKVAAKVSTGNVVYILAVPSIILADSGTLDLSILSATSSPNWVINNRMSLPASYRGVGLALTGASFSFAPTAPPSGSGLVVYASGSLPTNNSGALALANAIRASYSGSTLSSESHIRTFLNTTATESELVDLSRGLISNSLGGAAILTQQQAPVGGNSPSYVDDVFSTYLYTGNGSTQTINNGIDLAGNGGLVWTKRRDGAFAHQLIDTVTGVNKALFSDAVSAQQTYANSLTTFNSNGYTLGSDANGLVNYSALTYVGWTFRKAPRFFTENTFTHTGGTADTINLSTLGTIGMIVVKRTDNTSDWYTWHKDLTTGNNLKLNLTDAPSATNAYVSASGTSMTFSASAPSGTYVYYAWAHDVASDGIIQAGSFTTDTGGNASVNLGWEPQYVMVKSTAISSWMIADSMRGFTTTTNGNTLLYTNGTITDNPGNYIPGQPTGNGFLAKGSASTTYIYLAIRRPNKPPISGTQVYSNYALPSGTVSSPSMNFADMAFVFSDRFSGASSSKQIYDRLRGIGNSDTSGSSMCLILSTSAETSKTASPPAGLNTTTNAFLRNNELGVSLGMNSSTTDGSVAHFFRRAPGVFDMVAYTGNGSATTIPHNLGTAPELIITKRRAGSEAGGIAGYWSVYHKDVGNNFVLLLNTNDAKQGAGVWNNSTPTLSNFTVNNNYVNYSNDTYIAYLFASKANISKVGSYTGNGGTSGTNGTSQTINAGFSGDAQGARFILIKRTDDTGDWYVWDTARGIVAGADPHLSLNSTAAEVTTDDSVDPDGSGFIVNQTTATNINVTGATYIYLAIH